MIKARLPVLLPLHVFKPSLQCPWGPSLLASTLLNYVEFLCCFWSTRCLSRFLGTTMAFQFSYFVSFHILSFTAGCLVPGGGVVSSQNEFTWPLDQNILLLLLLALKLFTEVPVCVRLWASILLAFFQSNPPSNAFVNAVYG